MIKKVQYDCFISHSSADTLNATSLVEQLESRGLNCWIAPRNIRLGSNYPSEIVEGIASSSSLIVMISKDSLTSRHVEREVNIADEMGKKVYPVKLIDIEIYGGLRFYLAVSQEVCLFEDTGDPIEQLVSSIKGDANYSEVARISKVDDIKSGTGRRTHAARNLSDSYGSSSLTPNAWTMLKTVLSAVTFLVFLVGSYLYVFNVDPDSSASDKKNNLPDKKEDSLADKLAESPVLAETKNLKALHAVKLQEPDSYVILPRGGRIDFGNALNTEVLEYDGKIYNVKLSSIGNLPEGTFIVSRTNIADNSDGKSNNGTFIVTPEVTYRVPYLKSLAITSPANFSVTSNDSNLLFSNTDSVYLEHLPEYVQTWLNSSEK